MIDWLPAILVGTFSGMGGALLVNLWWALAFGPDAPQGGSDE